MLLSQYDKIIRKLNFLLMQTLIKTYKEQFVYNRIYLIFWDSSFEILKCGTQKIKKFFSRIFTQFILRQPHYSHKTFASK